MCDGIKTLKQNVWTTLRLSYHECKNLTHTNRGATSSSFQEGQFSWNFIRWRHRAYSTVVQFFRKLLR